MSYRGRDEPEEEEEDLPQQITELAQASTPSSLRGIRACKRCGILKTMEQFVNEGCENCPFLDMVSVLYSTSMHRCLYTAPGSENAGSDLFPCFPCDFKY